MTYISSLYNFSTKTIDRKTSTWSGPFSLPVLFSSDSHKIVSNELCHYVASFRFVVLETNLLALYCLHIYYYLFMWMFTTCYLCVICDTNSFHPYLLLGAFRNVSFCKCIFWLILQIYFYLFYENFDFIHSIINHFHLYVILKYTCTCMRERICSATIVSFLLIYTYINNSLTWPAVYF